MSRHPDIDIALDYVAAEVAHTRVLFPSNGHMLAALMEEVGELAQALLQGSPTWRDEAKQVACVAARIMTEGDADFPFTLEER